MGSTGTVVSAITTPPNTLIDDFNRADAANLSSPYVTVGSVPITSQKAIVGSNTGAFYNTTSQAQDVACDVTVPTTFSNVGITARHDGSGASVAPGYYFAMFNGTYYLFKNGGGVAGFSSLPAAGTVVRMRITVTSGHIVKCYANETLLYTYDDSASPVTGSYGGIRGNATAGQAHDNLYVGPLV